MLAVSAFTGRNVPALARLVAQFQEAITESGELERWAGRMRRACCTYSCTARSNVAPTALVHHGRQNLQLELAAVQPKHAVVWPAELITMQTARHAFVQR